MGEAMRRVSSFNSFISYVYAYWDPHWDSVNTFNLFNT